MPSLTDAMKALHADLEQRDSPDRYRDAAAQCYALTEFLPGLVMALEAVTDAADEEVNARHGLYDYPQIESYREDMKPVEEARALLREIEQRMRARG